MAICEFSGENCDRTIRVEIAGAAMNVSPKYTHLGKVLEESSKSTPFKSYTSHKRERIEVRVVDDAPKLIQQFMSKKNLTSKHVAHNANVKEGSLQKMLSGKIHFDLKTAQAIEKTFDLPLTQQEDVNSSSQAENYIQEEDENESTSQMESLVKGILDKIR